MYNNDPRTYVLSMADKTEITVEDVKMKQHYGFLVFHDIDNNEVYGVRAELVTEWKIREKEIKPAVVSRRVTRTR